MANIDELGLDPIALGSSALESQRTNNFRLEVDLSNALYATMLSLGCQVSQTPGESNEEIMVPKGNESYYLAGKAVIEPLNMSFKDLCDAPVRKAIMAWRREVYDPNTGQIGLAKNYKKRGRLILHAPDGSLLRIFNLLNVWPQALPAGSLDESSSEPLLAEVIFRCDKAIEQF